MRDIYRATLNHPDATPGMTVGIQTHGSLANWHPHLHAIVTDGAFLPDGTYLPMPHIPAEPFLRLWEEKLFALLLAENADRTHKLADRTHKLRFPAGAGYGEVG